MFSLLNFPFLLVSSPRTSLTTYNIWLKCCPLIFHTKTPVCNRCLRRVLIGCKAAPDIKWVLGKLREICHSLSLFQANSQEISWPRHKAEITKKLPIASTQKWHAGAYLPWQALQWNVEGGDKFYISKPFGYSEKQ